MARRAFGNAANTLKIATFNINNVNRRLPNLLAWLSEASPDVVCLQELKSTNASFPAAAIQDAGYAAVWRGQKSWNGVAILARGAEPVLTRRELPGDPSDEQSRYIEAAVQGILIGCIYLPNGNPQPGPKFDYKNAWCARLIGHAAKLQEAKVPVALAGDYNVVPTDDDIYPTSPGRGMRCSSLDPGRHFGGCSPRAGRTQSGPCIRGSEFTRSGITSGIAGLATRGCASTTYCSAPS